MRDVGSQLLALPVGMPAWEQAKSLGVSLSVVYRMRQATGVAGIRDRMRADEDREIMARFVALAPCSQNEAARRLGVTLERLRGARQRAGMARVEMPVDVAAEAPSFPQRSAEALPAGHPLTWGAISSEPWPGVSR
jgi:hypothetical protein